MAESSSPHSQTSSPPGGYKVKDENEDDQFRETELFEDTLVIDCPFTETEVGNLNMDTEIVEDLEPAEDMTTDTMCGYEQVVLDSEDEVMNDRDVGKGFLEDETSPTVKVPSTLFQKRHAKPPCEQVDAYATTFGKSASGNKGALVDVDNFDDNNHLYPPGMLSHIHSPEPGDSTKVALGFVDQYLSSNDVDLFEGIHRGKTTREKSPHVPGARGLLNLAMKIKARTQNEEKDPFKWIDSCQHDNRTGMFDKKMVASSNFGRYKQTYTRREKKGSLLHRQGNCSTSTSNRCDEKSGQGPRMATESNNSLKELDVQPSPIRDNANIYSGVTHIEDMYDIGLDTQIAAEAMDALAFVAPSSCQFSDNHQPENALDSSLSNKNEAYLENSSYIQNPGLHSITIKSNKKNASSSKFSKITLSSSCEHADNQKPNLVSGKMKKAMKSKSTAERQFENNTSLRMHSKHVPLEEVCSLGEYVCFQPAAEEPKNWNNESRQHTAVKEKGIKSKRKGNCLVVDAVKLGVKTKRLKFPTNSCAVARKNRLNHLAQVSPQLSATSSFSRTDSWVYPKRPRGKRKGDNVGTNLDAQAVLYIDGKENNVFSSCFSRTGSWVYPKRSRGKRKGANVGTNTDVPTVLGIDGKENTVFSSKSLENQTDVDKSCFPHTPSLCNASCIDDGTCLLQGNFVLPDSASDAIKVEKLHGMHPLLLAHIEISSNKSVAQSRPEIAATVAAYKGIEVSNANHTYTSHHKKPCEKTLPKTLVLKERLGVPDFTSDMMWKGLRHRRDMTHVRVLFSQHLDDSIIKQQRKILTRLNISIASSSMEATHFIADKFKRTKNMLETMALGKLVVNHLWLESCGQSNCFIDEKNYILRDMKKEKEIGFNMSVSLARARQEPLLKGKRVYITPHIKPDKELLASLVTIVHGQVVDESKVCADMNDNILNDLLILSCEDDYAICHCFLERGMAVYSSELVLNGIVIQKLELERFTEGVEPYSDLKLIFESIIRVYSGTSIINGHSRLRC
ncbi:hypothetical protein VNO78_17994 [Psophocarpus tetragonolobus]|uniref:BRCT domain-containing protein n=1 Tax=Psophocarpus tetragonolobus TaxID=3891 RepID=A0AAN9SHN6_PSOTE